MPNPSLLHPRCPPELVSLGGLHLLLTPEPGLLWGPSLWKAVLAGRGN